ncbi:unnamed protein product [Zymoseptoria tritici ST99CH_1E4]|uniref:F-box domain-containing protein n=1 Tax=Zymoseptoria tritici ST99CH_1E4 TaxID=1276532 RepID=A0A2H1H4F0_ZYMTR|nr:unnamed protein product [Zymoseptoria tritici ST99CH_1E4]
MVAHRAFGSRKRARRAPPAKGTPPRTRNSKVATPSLRTTLMGLPTELRLHIYEALWATEHELTIHTDIPGSRLSQRETEDPDTVGRKFVKTRTALLCVNKQIYQEAKTVLWSHSDLDWTYEKELPFPSDQPKDQTLWKRARFPARAKPYLSSMSIRTRPGWYMPKYTFFPFSEDDYSQLEELQLFFGFHSYRREWIRTVVFAGRLVKMFSANSAFKKVAVEMTSVQHGAVYFNTSCLIGPGEFSSVFKQSECERRCDEMRGELEQALGDRSEGVAVEVLWKGYHGEGQDPEAY